MAGIDRRGALKLFGAAGAAAAAAGLGSACSPAQSPDEPTAPQYDSPVRIGLLVPGTGGYKPIGDEILNGFRRYLQTTGNRLGGHPVVEEAEDEGDSAETAREGLLRLLDRDVHAVVGLASSAAIMEVSEVVEQEHVPLLGANASPRDLQGVPYVWRTSYLNQEPGLALGRHLAGAVDGPVAIVAQDNLTGTDAVAGLQEAYATAQATDRLAEPIFTADESQPGEDAFAAALAQVRDQDPEAVFCVYAGAPAVEFVRQYVDAGLDPARLHAPAYLTEGEALEALGEAAVGIRTSANYAAELRGGANRAFAVGYRAEFGTPTIYAVASYDAAAALDAAVRLTGGEPTRRQINLTLGEIGLIDSPRGRWQFNQARTPTQKWYLREVGHDGPVLANLVLKELGRLG
ncbi:MAG: ABC transporter substrate-binding protein [Micromonosporaceae bacterium]|nr:ABC transporter substrate-binding protein [Micromonosporaceae bacterium]